MNNGLDGFLRIKKILAFLASIGLIGVSIWFSQKGFGIESNGEYEWVGLFLGIIVTIVQLVFNTSIRNLNPTLIGSGILAYGYGIYTNVTGLRDIFNGFGMAIIVGLIIEVLAEPLFAWSVDAHSGGDVIGNIGQMLGFERSKPVRQENQPRQEEQRPQTYKPNYPPKPQQQGKRPDSDLFRHLKK